MIQLVRDWGGFEELIADLNRTGKVTVQKNVVLTGKSGAPRQIDVLITHTEGLYSHKILVECKYWNSNIKRTHIDAMVTAIEDLSASKGVFFTTKGYQSGALTMARSKPIDMFIVRERTNEEWGLPGKVIDFFIQYISRSIGNFRFPDSQAFILDPDLKDLTGGNLKIRLGTPDTTSVTSTFKADGSYGKSLEAIIDDAALQALDIYFAKPFTINGGEECTRYMKGYVEVPFEPPLMVQQQGYVLKLPKMKFDLGIKIEQTRFIHDRSSAFYYALIVKNCVNEVVYSACRRKGEEVAILKELPPKNSQPSEDLLINGGVLRVVLEDWFDFSEMDYFTEIPSRF
jgi:hypothetical protein